MNKKRVLILCTGNSCRSQMAEGFLRNMAGDKFEVFSAGVKPTQVNSLAIKVMAEAGIDISKYFRRFYYMETEIGRNSGKDKDEE